MTAFKTAAECLTWMGITTPTAQQTAVMNQLVSSVMGLIVSYIGYNPIRSSYTEFLPSVDNLIRPDPLLSSFNVSSTGRRALPMRQMSQSNRTLSLRVIPVREITSVHENIQSMDVSGGVWPSSSLLSDTEYYLDFDKPGYSMTGILVRSNGQWPTSPRCVKVVYEAGYTTAEIDENLPDMNLAFLTEMQIQFQQSMVNMPASGANKFSGGPVSGYSIGDFSVSYDGSTMARLYGMSAGKLTARTMSMLSKYVSLSNYF